MVTSPPYYWQRDYQVDGQLGHEHSVEAYVEGLRAVFHEVARVLKMRGLAFLVLGDTYYSGKGRPHGGDRKQAWRGVARKKYRAVDRPGFGLPRKSLIGIPWRVALARMKQLAALAFHAKEPGSLLGVEGTAARVYFEQFATLLSPRTGGGGVGVFSFESRNRRPPRDPVNALLSFGYALLAKDCRIALQGVGFDPMVGFYHRPRHGRPALALDLMEEFRPLVVDSTVLSAVNTEVVRASHFVHAAGGCSLTDDGRRAFLGAYERRMDTEITHPVFGYTITYRRVLEVQARLLARAVQGELARYPGFRTR